MGISKEEKGAVEHHHHGEHSRGADGLSHSLPQGLHIHIHVHNHGDACCCGEQDDGSCSCQEHDHAEHAHSHDHHDHAGHEAHDHDDHHDHEEHDHEGHDHHDHDEHDHEGHDHEHDDPVSISRHEQSVIGVFKYAISEPYARALEIVEKKMAFIANAVDKQDGVIGHIKSFVVSEGDRCQISITDIEEGPLRRPLHEESAHFETVVIVLCIEEEALRKIIKEAFKEYLETPLT